MNTNKDTLRRRMIRRRNQLSTTVRQEASRAITRALLALDVYRKARIVLCYASLPEEVGTWEIIRQGWKDGKIVGLPGIRSGAEMDFYQVDGMESLCPKPAEEGVEDDRRGLDRIPQPGNDCRLLETADLIIVPAIAFDLRGNRLGYGGGYYDRYLAKHIEIPRIGLAFEEQIVAEVPTDKWDIPISGILTEQRRIQQK